MKTKSAGLRSMFYWLRLAEQYMFIIIVAAVAILGYLYLRATKSELEYSLGMLPVFMIGFITVLLFAITLGNQLYASIVISFGSTRKNVFWGIHFMNLLIILQITLILIIYCMVYQKYYVEAPTLIFLNITALAAACGIGDIIAVLVRKFERVGKGIFGAICGLFSAAIGFTVASNIGDSSIVSWLEENVRYHAYWIAGVSAAVYLIGAVLYYNSVKKLEVRV